ncbi:MAG: PAS domain S-box protein [Bacteroidota bacterium]
MSNGKSKVRFPKNLIVIFTAIFIIASFLSFYFFDQQKKRIESEIYADLKSVADLKIDQLVQWIKDRSGDAAVISQSPFFIKNFDEWFKDKTNKKEEDEIKKRLTLLIKLYDYESIFITDQSGNNLLTVGLSFDSYDEITKSKILEAFNKKEITITGLYYCSNENKIHYDLIAPLYNSSNQPTAFLVLRVNPYNYLYPLIQKWPKKSRTAETLIVRKDGDSVLFLNELRHLRNTALKLKATLSSSIPAAEAVKGKVGFIESADYRGVGVIAYVNKVPNSNWLMVSKIDKDEIFEPLYSFTLFYTIFALSGFGLFVVLIVFVWKRTQYKEKISDYEKELERERLKQQYDFLIKHANDVMFLVDEKGNIVQANDSTEHLFGYSVAEITKLNLSDVVVFQNLMEKTTKRILHDGSLLFEVVYAKKDGSQFPAEVSAKAFKIENKTYIQEIIRDISERKKFENEILNKNAILNAIINNSHSINIFMIDRDYRYIKFNENHRLEMKKNFAVNIDIGMNMLDCIPKLDYKTVVKQSINKVLAGESFVELKYDKPSNTYYEYHWNQVRKPDDEIFAASCFVIDITERKKAEEALMVLSSRQSAILSSVPDIIMEVNDQKIYTWANKAGYDFFGDDVIGKEAAYYFKGEQETYNKVQPLFNGSEDIIYVESWQRRKDGKVRLLAWWCRVLKDNNGKVTGAISTARDITEQKKTEQEIVRLNRVYAILSNINQTIVRVKERKKLFDEVCRIALEDGKFKMVWIGIINSETAETEVAPNEQSSIEKKSMELCYCLSNKVIKSTKYFIINDLEKSDELLPCKKDTIELGCKSSASFPIKVHGKVLGTFNLFSTEKDFFQEDEIKLLDEMTMDISFALEFMESETERKHAEETLRASEEQFRLLFENSPVGIGVADLNGNILAFNSALLKQGSYTYEDAIQMRNVTKLYFDPQEREKVLSIFRKQGLVKNYPILFKRKDGNPYNAVISLTKTIFKGQPCIQAIIEDVTDRIKAEEQLKESEERFRGLYENSTIGLYRTTPDGKIILANPALVKLLGFNSFEELTRRNLQQLGFESEHPRKDFLSLIESKGVVHGIESVWQRKDGTYINVRESANIIRDANGKTLYYDGTVEDITERKKAEKALVESEKKFRSVVEEAVEIVFTVDNNGYFTYVNPAGIKASGYTLDELKKIKYIDMIEPDYKQRVKLNYIRQYLQRIESTSTEYPFRSKSGEIKWFNQNARLIVENNTVKGFYVIARDVTERRKTADALKESEERFRYLFETSYEGILAADEDENIYLANPRMAEMLGYSVEELKKMAFKELITTADLKDHFLKKEIRKSGKSEFYERRLVKKDGSLIWTLIAAVPTFNKEGKYTGSFGMFTDITKRKQAEEATIKLSNAVIHSPVSIVITDKNGNIEYVNPMFTKITGYSLEEVLGENPRILKSGSQTKEFYQKMWNTILAGKDFVGEMHNKKKNGEYFWENAYISPIANKNGDITHFVAVKEDITEKKKNIEELISAKDKAEKADKLKSEFLAQMSHEIRTPINVILSFNNILKDEVGDKLEPELYKMFESVEFASSRIIRTIDMILNMSELQTGTYEPNFKMVNIRNNVLNRLITEHYRIAKEKKLELISRYYTEELNIRADEYSVIQIFNNLIDNAIKYTNKGKVEVEVRRNDENKLEVVVADTGIGIGKEYLPKLFEPFSQEEQGYSRLYEGNGLGLALVKRYCEVNEAEIFVESEKGAGSRFKVVFK